MLASSWIEESNCQSAWLSLSEEENDLRTIIGYIVAAIQKIFPDKLTMTKGLVDAADMPPTKIITHNLVNELDQIQENFIVVLDDYHLIHNNDVHSVIDELLRYPPEYMHLCLLTRSDPALRIKKFRALNRMTEIRMDDLSFSAEEIVNLFEKIHGIKLEISTAVNLYQKTEGWITALRLTSIALRKNPEFENSLASFNGDLHSLSDYLAEEILSELPEQMKDLLLCTALLDAFCFDLIKSCFMSLENEAIDETDFTTLFDKLITSDLFIISLDEERNWFRYHHLFQRILLNQFKNKYNSERIHCINLAAARWYEKEGMIDQALNKLISEGEVNQAAELVKAHAHAEFLKGVGKVNTWLNKLPHELIENNPSLLLLTAWHAFGQFHLEKIPPILEKLRILIKDTEPDPQVLSELYFFEGNFQYWMGDTEGSIETLSKALENGSSLPSHVRCNIELVLAFAKQRNGAYDAISCELNSRVSESDQSEEIDRAYLYGSLAFVQLLSAKLRKAFDVAKQMQLYSEKIGAVYLLNWSYYFQASSSFQLFETDKALEYFKIISQKQFMMDTVAVIDAKAAVALIHQFTNNSEDAIILINDAIEDASETNIPQSLMVIRSAQARIALLMGDIQGAAEWAKTFDEPPNFAGMFMWQEVPWITKAKVLISIGTKESLHEAESLLNNLYELAAPAHLMIHLVEIDLLLSLVFFKSDQIEKSAEKMKAAVVKAEEEGFVRPFIEMGTQAIEPMEMLLEQNICEGFIRRISSLITERDRISSGVSQKNVFATTNMFGTEKVELTKREIETLQLLAGGLRNKEIANEIYVSEGTVKKHIYNMGQKFNTSTRVDLINKARAMGLINAD
jgi:LuxR family maltose regulon positive regulatory protein